MTDPADWKEFEERGARQYFMLIVMAFRSAGSSLYSGP
jgi:hypothetical protein